MLYWFEEDVEGEWSKSSATTKEEMLEYETDQRAEDVASFGAASSSLDPTMMHGLGPQIAYSTVSPECCMIYPVLVTLC